MNDRIKIEPSAEQRVAAKTLRALYIALIDEEFTDQQALVILGQIMAVNAAGSS